VAALSMTIILADCTSAFPIKTWGILVFSKFKMAE
jgi:hypothetical protein